MKRLFVALTVLSLLVSTSTHSLSREKVSALIQTIISGGTLSISAALFQETGNNIILEGAKHLYAQVGFGSCISQIRMHAQQIISRMHSGSVQNTLEIERVVYLATGLIAAALLIDGIATLLSDSTPTQA